jgi:hypothetical protein
MAEPASTVQMYDPATGAVVGVAPEKAAEAYRSGALTFGNDSDVPVQVDGKWTSIKGSQAAKFFGSSESLLSPVGSAADLQAQQDRDTYGGLGGATFAAGTGALQSLGLGFGDAGLVGGAELFGRGDEARELIEKTSRINPGARMLGELGGFVAPAAISGGSSLLARGGGSLARAGLEGATLLPRAAAGLGSAVEHGAARGLAALGAAEGGLATRILAPAAGQAVEQGLYGIGHAVSESAIKNEDLTAEKLLAHGGMAALLGAGVGGVIGGGGMLVRGIGERAASLGERAVGLGERVAGLEGTAGKAMSERVAGLAEHLLEGTATGKTLQQLGEREAGHLNVAATGASKEQLARLTELGAGVEASAVKQMEDLRGLAGSKSLATTTPERLAEAAAKNVPAKRAVVEGLAHEVDALGETAMRAGTVDGSKLAAKLDKLAGALDDVGGHEAAVGALSKVSAKLKGLGADVPLSELTSAASALGAGAAKGEAKSFLTKAESMLEGEMLRAGAKRLEGSGAAQLSAKFAAASDGLQAARWLQEAAAHGAASKADAGINALKHAFTGATSVGSISGLPGAALAGAGTAAVSYLKERFGQQLTAEIANKAVRSDLITSISAALDRRLATHVDGFFGRTAQGVGAAAQTLGRATHQVVTGGASVALSHLSGPKNEPIEKRYQRTTEAVAGLSVNLNARLAPMNANISTASPTLAQKADAVAARGVQAMQAKMPVRPASQSLTPHAEVPQPSTAAMASFLRFAKAVEDPMSVLEDARKGQISREGAEALRAVYPALYGELQGRVTTHLAEQTKPLPYAQKLQLAILLDVPADRTMTDGFIKRQQEAMAGTPGKGPGGAGGAGGSGSGASGNKSVNIAGNLAPRTDGIGGKS